MQWRCVEGIYVIGSAGHLRLKFSAAVWPVAVVTYTYTLLTAASISQNIVGPYNSLTKKILPFLFVLLKGFSQKVREECGGVCSQKSIHPSDPVSITFKPTPCSHATCFYIIQSHSINIKFICLYRLLN